MRSLLHWYHCEAVGRDGVDVGVSPSLYVNSIVFKKSNIKLHVLRSSLCLETWSSPCIYSCHACESYALCFLLLLPSVKKTPRARLDRKARDITTQQQQLTKTVSGESTEWSEVVGGVQDTVASASLSLLLYHITLGVRYSVPSDWCDSASCYDTTQYSIVSFKWFQIFLKH